MKHSSTIKLFPAIVLTQMITIFTAFTARGQWPAFGVYHTAGTIKCVAAHGGATRPLTEHSWLYEGDKLMLLDNIAEIILFDRDTNYIRLHGKGNYTTADIKKIQRSHIRDNITVRYISLLWDELIRPGAGTQKQKEQIASSTGGVVRGLSLVIAPRDGYATSMDSLIFCWHSVSWARKYFLRLRNPDGQLCYDSVIVDTQAVVHFPGRMTAGNYYTWTLDIVGESGRLQFADSNHIVLVNESAILPQLPPITPDSIGGIAVRLQQIEQYENASCTKQANDLFLQLTTDFPEDAALGQLYAAFRQRNYF
jgi:hypothetical protein